nr:MAG: Prophage endopeptidase tail [Bacteriophage sp.]
MGYKVLYDNQLLFDPYTDDHITDTKLSSKLNAASYFDFTIAPTHSLYSKLAERAGEVRIYFNNLILFKGEISKIEEDFEGNYSVSCTGVLDYLTATRVRPYSTIEGEQPLKAPSSYDSYFQWLIDQHNSNCLDSRKHFSVGVNQGNMLDKNNYIYRASEQRPTTASEIEDKILNSAGGYLFVRYQDDLNILDLYADVHDVNTQIIDYGVNMLDFTKTTTTEGQYTAVVATGYTPDPPEGQTDVKMKPITLDGCTDGGTPYSSTIVKMGDRVYDVEAVKRYGYHEYYVSNTDVKTYDGLLYYACKTLNTLLSPALTISVKAVDLALIMGDKYKHLQLGQAVRIRSKPRKVDEYLMVNSIDLDLMNPDNTTFDLGASYDTLTGQQSAYLKTLNASINSSLDTVAALGDNVKNSAKLAQEAKDTANSAVSKAEVATTKATDASAKASEATTKADDAVTKATEATTKANLVENKAEEAKSAADSAKQAADEANAAAGNAQTSADNANQAATEAKNSADEANAAASNAQSTADSALSSAAQANKDVSNVKTQITDINKEITSVKQDASTLRDDLTGQITTVKETMEADYAKKSELSSTESALKTEISKSAAGIRTEVSQTYSTKKELETTTKAAQTAKSTADAAKKAAESNASDLANAVSKFNGDISGLKDQIDGAIQTWFYDGIPNALTEPEVNWTTEKDRQTHLGDLYYDNQTGFCYRYMNQNGVYSWERILDTDVTKALSDAAKAQNTANAKKRIFVTTPTPPYDIGDLWVQGSTGDIMSCQTPKIDSQAYAASDWVKASKYTDDTAVTNLSNTVERTYATKSTVNQLSDRIEQTVSSVEEVRTDASAANTTAANAKKAADNAASAAATAQSTASAAQTKATAAASAAATAQTAADKAKENATSAANAAAVAQSKANAAQTAADDAKANASAAQTAADAANADLVTAKQNLEDLQGRADATDSEIAAAKTAVSKAQTAADAANSAASKANTAASKAQSTADTAKANAATAQTKANEAATAASTAQSTADTAKQNAATAQSKANAAASAASTAQSTADTAKANAKKAQDDVNALKNRVTSAETKITQNSEAIALRATKTEVTSAIYDINVGGSNLLTKTADSSITTIEAVNETSGANYGMVTDRFQAAAGKKVTISCEVEMVDFVYSRRVGTEFSHGRKHCGVWLDIGADGSTKNNLRKRVYTTFTLPSEASSWTYFDECNCYIQGAISGKCTVRNPKLELGNKPTDWSPAPEDLQADATNKANTALSESRKYTDAQLKITSDSITSTVSNTYAPKLYPDTRYDNHSPDWYIVHYPRQSITEFKLCSVIGLSGDTFCSLLTEVPWSGPSGGYPKQTASVLNKRYWRVGTNGSTWGAWNDVTGLATNASSTANTALSTATTANSTANSVKSDLANNYTKTIDTLRTYHFGWRNAATPGWIKLGTLTSLGDNSSVTINVWSGDGFNGSASQNADWRITIKDGYQQTLSAIKAFGVTVNYGLHCDGVTVMVRATAYNVCDVWCYLPWSAPHGRYSIQGRYSKWEHTSESVLPQSSEPSEGEAQSIIQETWTTVTNMQSSINQTAESIKSTVAATYVNNKTLSSYATKSQLEQTSTSLTSRIQTTENTVSGMSTTVKNVNDYMTFARENNQPTLTIGSSSSSFRTKLTNTGEKFMQGDQTIMELDGITSTVKASRVQMGHYQWRDTGTSMQLVYVP